MVTIDRANVALHGHGPRRTSSDLVGGGGGALLYNNKPSGEPEIGPKKSESRKVGNEKSEMGEKLVIGHSFLIM
jgi:hypothetical protein